VGLCLAIDRFNPRKYNNRFSTYAVPWIKLKIFREITESHSMVHVPPHVAYQTRQYRRIMKDQDEDMALTDKELMERLDVNERGLRNVRMAQNSIFSLSEVRYADEDGHETTVGETIADTKSPSAPKILYEQERKEIIHKALAKLDPLHRDILMCRYLKNSKDGLGKLGKKYGITGERIRQIEFKALKKLRFRLKKMTTFGDL